MPVKRGVKNATLIQRKTKKVKPRQLTGVSLQTVFTTLEKAPEVPIL
jgi:hypothetical protein